MASLSGRVAIVTGSSRGIGRGIAGRLGQDGRTTLEAFGHLDIVVSNAGNLRFGGLAELSEDVFEAVFGVNARGTFFTLREAARHIGDGGRIVNLSSSATSMTIPGLALYVGSKVAGEQFARTLARELGPRGITVNNVLPGFTETDMLPQDPAYRTFAAQSSFLGRIGQPEEIADVVAFLVSDEARWVTGQNVQAAGAVV